MNDYCSQRNNVKGQNKSMTHVTCFLQVHFVTLLHRPHVVILLLQSSHQFIQLQGLTVKKQTNATCYMTDQPWKTVVQTQSYKSGCCRAEGPPAAPSSSWFHPGPHSAGPCRAHKWLSQQKQKEKKDTFPTYMCASSFRFKFDCGGRTENGVLYLKVGLCLYFMKYLPLNQQGRGTEHKKANAKKEGLSKRVFSKCSLILLHWKKSHCKPSSKDIISWQFF